MSALSCFDPTSVLRIASQRAIATDSSDDSVITLGVDDQPDLACVPDRLADLLQSEPADQRILFGTFSRAHPLLRGFVGTLLAPWMACPLSKYSGLYMLPFSGLSAPTG